MPNDFDGWDTGDYIDDGKPFTMDRLPKLDGTMYDKLRRVIDVSPELLYLVNLDVAPMPVRLLVQQYTFILKSVYIGSTVVSTAYVDTANLLGAGTQNIVYSTSNDSDGAVHIDNITGEITVDVSISDNGTNKHATIVGVSADGRAASKDIVIHIKILLLNNPPSLILTAAPNGDISPMLLPYKAPFIDPGATAYDAEDGDITSDIIVTNDAIDTTVAGTYIVTYEVSDSVGNTATVNREIIVAENVAPVITITGDNPLTEPLRGEPRTRYWGVKGKGPSFSKVALAKIELLNQDGVNVITSPYYAYTSGSADGAFDGNPNTLGIVDVWGTEAEVGWMGGSILDHGVITTLKLTAQSDFSIDPQPPNTLIRLVYQDVPFGSTLNYYDLYHNWVDLLVIGNETWAPGETKTYNVVTQPPALSLPYTDMGATASDFEDGDLTSSIVVSGDTVDVTTPGTYNVTYTVTDNDGLTTTATREVIVKADIGGVN